MDAHLNQGLHQTNENPLESNDKLLSGEMSSDSTKLLVSVKHFEHCASLTQRPSCNNHHFGEDEQKRDLYRLRRYIQQLTANNRRFERDNLKLEDELASKTSKITALETYKQAADVEKETIRFELDKAYREFTELKTTLRNLHELEFTEEIMAWEELWEICVLQNQKQLKKLANELLVKDKKYLQDQMKVKNTKLAMLKSEIGKTHR